jgi:hypothetical protein
MDTNGRHTDEKAPAPVQKKTYATPELTTYGDVVEQTLRGHTGGDKNRKSLGK